MIYENFDFHRTGAKWIWQCADPGDSYVNQYVEFRHEFELTDAQAGKGLLHLSVDSEYALWINGMFIDCGQYDDFPSLKFFDTLDVSRFLLPGTNVMLIDCYFQGAESFQYTHGTPGLIYVLTAGGVTIRSSCETKCRPALKYYNGPIEMITAQLGYTFSFDASRVDGSVWAEAVEVEMPLLNGLSPRPIEKLVIQERMRTTVVSQGSFARIDRRESIPIARMMQGDYLSWRQTREIFSGKYSREFPNEDGLEVKNVNIAESTGIYLIIDLGREEAGLFELEIDAPSGTVVDIAYGEHLEDGRVRAFVGGRNFAFRYICGEGRWNFLYPFKRFAGRYIQLNIHNFNTPFKLHYAGFRPTGYPAAKTGVLKTSDSLHDAIAEVCVKTLELCMHEHYEDCPWREQALYAMDSRNQALCGYYAFGEYRFPRASFALLGDSIQSDSYLELCAPAHPPITIPCFSLAWIIEMGEYMMYSGDIDFLKEYLPTIRRMLEMYLHDAENGLMTLKEGKRYWNYYEWSAGLDNTKPPEDPRRLDAPLNLFLCLALEQAARIAHYCCDSEFSARCSVWLMLVRERVHAVFWDESASAYRTYAGAGAPTHFAELVQSLAICAGVAPESIAPALRVELASGQSGWVPITLSHSIFKFNALLGEPEKYGRIVFDLIARDWGKMLRSGATSFWETIEGASAFDDAGSLCHGWSAVPLYFYYAYVLGVKPVEPGFAEYIVAPVAGGFEYAQGSVPTPNGGRIEVSWKMTADGLKYDQKYIKESMNV